VAAPATNTIPEDRPAFAAARGVCRAQGWEGFHAAYFLPPHKRRAVQAVCAFAAMIEQSFDRAVQAPSGGDSCGCGPGGDVAKIADHARARVEDLYSARTKLPLPAYRDDAHWTLAAVARTLRRFEIPRAAWITFIDALASHAGIARYATWRSLEEFFVRTGGSIATIIAAVLGATHSEAGEYARRVGSAARFISLLLRVRDDCARGRVSLPLEDLARFRYSERELFAGTANERLEQLIRFEADRARSMLVTGADGICWLAGDGSRMAAATYVTAQLALVDAISRKPVDVLRGRVRLTAARRWRALPDAWRLAKRQPAEPLPKLS